MLKGDRYQYKILLSIVTVIVIVISIAAGYMVNANPRYLFFAILAGGVLYSFFTQFEYTVPGLLILRSFLDPFSAQQIPAAFAIGLDALTLLYVTVQLLTRRTVHTDGFWWFFASWVALQGLWLILMPMGALGLDASYLSYGIREWVRIFSWLMVYLLVMQLKGRLPPETIISRLFLALVLPLTAALMQMFLPESLLPSVLVPQGFSLTSTLETASRINGTLGHPNTFTTFLFFFLGLTYWKQGHAQRRQPWLILLGILAIFFVSTKALFGLLLLGILIVCLIAPKLSLPSLVGGIVLFALVIALFGSSEFGQERLGSIAETPLGNPDIDIWKAILLSAGDGNSFNWRIAQWTYLLTAWQQYPILGFGLGTSTAISNNGLLPHNDFIRVLVEGGIVGLITYLAFLSFQIVRLVQLIRKAPPRSGQRDLCLVLLAIILAIPVGMITENIWSHTTLFFYWWTVFAVAGWNWKELQSVEKPTPTFSNSPPVL
jgi:O-antigen ligase